MPLKVWALPPSEVSLRSTWLRRALLGFARDMSLQEVPMRRMSTCGTGQWWIPRVRCLGRNLGKLVPGGKTLDRVSPCICVYSTLIKGLIPCITVYRLSCCSGSEGARFCFEALGVLAAEMGAGISFRHIFSCECNEEKIQWIQMVNDLAPAAVASMNARLGGQNSLPPARPPVEEDARPCVFTDICKLGQSSAPCAAHARKPDSTASEAAAASSSAARVSDRAKSLVSDSPVNGPLPQSLSALNAICIHSIGRTASPVTI